MKRNYKTGLILGLSLVLTMVLSACGASKEGTQADGSSASGSKDVELLNVSYDPTRELYEAYNKAFAAHWEKEKGQKVTIKQSHGGSGKQSRSVQDGLDADVVTLALGYDIDALQEKGLVKEGWQSKYEHNSSPYTSTIVLLVRKGNPKGIKDWDDLVRGDVQVITPNPKTSGGARWNYLAAWAYALKKNNNDEAKAQQFVQELYKHVPVLDSGARGATTTFVERGIGDVLIAWENEALLSVKELGADKFDIVYPSISILAEPPVAVVDKVVDKKGTREVADAYLKYLYSEEGQTIAAENYYRPTLESVTAKYKDQFPNLELVTLKDVFGTWKETQQKHFSDKGIFDQIYVPGSS
ncbi:sulfate ABC transporter substrate-binding protein [Paenibacillus polymyxa]|uniref:sulfate ABC transporter substrate-binding protein n=1 Tax=Paenibacillus TaxID=44249 RepID=UPI00042F373F|nr:MULTISPECIES: sulfate ABC transporter substrate-binding protein [Paenibacillus]AHM67998.1 sulfate adenylyltransferase, large subunit [Paenibacillus polymyxa SQR-21]AIY08704.1 sulfate transporter subunit [Paenibacillus polymyxa]MDN4083457.1 sulfate ABC transporter substrate-binding protein [Paenibacillus polymyxa]MDN4110472.1 sulfate ABC transporter substrate-binding protein [Paenibacillus polymyxa]MEE4580244.1 sulfate ABC transporter substrate-binding protein [Paenibacillus polymyxa]